MALASALLTEIRRPLYDETATYRWSDAVLLVYINKAITEIFALHPESACTSDTAVTVVAPTDMSATTETIGLRAEYHQAIIEWVCWKVFGGDSADENNLRLAKEHEAAWKARMGIS